MTAPTLLLHSMATPQRDPAGCLLVAAGLGLAGIELIVDTDYPAAVRPDTPARALAALRAEAAGRGLRIAALSPYPRGLASADPAARRGAADLLRRAVDLADALGAGGIRVLAGETGGDPGRAVATLREVAGSAAAAAGVSLNLENHMDTLACTARATRELCEATAHPAVGILYDQANLTLLGAEPPDLAVAVQGPAIRHVHVKDFLPRAGDRRPVGLGAGVVDWPATVAALRCAGYAGTVTFEYERRWYPDDLPPPEVGLPADIQMLRRLFEEAG